MSYIKRIEVTHFKGAPQLAQDLKPLTVIVGPNFSGKTRILDAIRILLLGYHPRLGRRPGDTFALVSGASCSLIAEFGDGSQVARSFAMKKGAVSAGGLKEPLVPAMLLDANEYFGLTGPERVKYVVSNFAGDTGMDDDELLSEIRNAITKGIEIATPSHEAARAKIEGDIKELVDAREHEGVSMADCMQAITALVAAALTEATATVKRLTGSIQTTSVQGAPEDAPNQNAEQEYQEVQKQRDAVLKKQIEASGVHAAWEVLKDKHWRATEALKAWPDRSKEINELKQQVDDSLSQQAANFAEELRLASAVLAGLKAGSSSKTTTITNDNRNIAAAEKAIENQIKVQCPCCGKSGEECPATMAAISVHKKTITRLKKGIASVEDAKAKQDLEIKAQDKRVKGLEDGCEAARKAAHAAEATRRRLGELQLAQVKHDNAREAVAQLGQLPPEPNGDALEKVNKELAIIEAKLAQANEAVKRLAAWRNDMARREQSKQEFATANAEVEILKIVKTTVAGLQDALVTECFSVITDRARRFTDDILLSPLAYHEGEMGRWNGSTFVSHRAFSGAEEAMAYAGLSVALVTDAKHKIVMFDEMGRLSDETRTKLLVRLRDLISDKVIDQALLVDVEPKDYQMYGMVIQAKP